MAAQGLLEASFSSNSVPNGLKLRTEKLNGRPQEVSITTFYELPRVLASIRAHAACFVALQFPEAMLPDASAVLWALESALDDGTDLDGRPVEEATTSSAPQSAASEPPLLYVLGDTSYGEASVDEVAAAHLPTDLIVHFGPSTLAPAAGNVPVLHVFNQRPLSHPAAAARAVAAALTKASQADVTTAADSTGSATAPILPPLVFVYDAAYGAGASAVATCLREDHGVVVRLGVPPHPAEEQRASRTGCCTTASQNNNSKSTMAGVCAGSRGSDVGAGGGCCTGSNGDGSGNSGGDTNQSGSSSSNDRGSDHTATSEACRSTEKEGVLLIGGLEVKLAPQDSVSSDGGVGSDSNNPNTTAASASTTTEGDAEEVEARSEALLASHAVCFLGSDGWQLDSVLMRCEMAKCCLVLDPEAPTAAADDSGGTATSADASTGPSASSTTSTTSANAATATDESHAPTESNLGAPPVYQCVPAKAVSGALRRRFYQVARCRDANVMGVVVGTLGVRHYKEVVARVVTLIENSGRKAYVLALGTPNVAKLTNFPEIDAFVLVASPETALLDARDFPSPVVTPLELEVALGLRAWNGNYSTDFSDLLRDAPPPSSSSSSSSTERTSLGKPDSGAKGASRGKAAGGGDVFQGDQDAPSFSLVTSKFEDSRRLRGKASSQQQAGEKVSLAFESTENGGNSRGGGSSHSSRALATYHSPAAAFLASRSYQGLEQRLGEDAPHLAVQGRNGIASGYGDEGHFTAPPVQPIPAVLSIEQGEGTSGESSGSKHDDQKESTSSAGATATEATSAASTSLAAMSLESAPGDAAAGDDDDDSAAEEDTGASAGGALENFLSGFDSD